MEKNMAEENAKRPTFKGSRERENALKGHYIIKPIFL